MENNSNNHYGDVEFANVGWAKLGESKGKGKGAKMLTEFKITDMQFENGNFIEDKDISKLIKNKKELDIFLFYNDIGKILITNYIFMYKKDGKTLIYCKNGIIQDTGKKHSSDCSNCKEYKNGKCDRISILNFGLDVNPIIGATYQLKTKGYYLIKNLINSLEEIKRHSGGILKAIPLKLIVQPQQTSKGQKTVPKIIFRGTLFELKKAANRSQKRFDEIEQKFKLKTDDIIEKVDEENIQTLEEIEENTINSHDNDVRYKLIKHLNMTENEAANYLNMSIKSAIAELNHLIELKNQPTNITGPPIEEKIVDDIAEKIDGEVVKKELVTVINNIKNNKDEQEPEVDLRGIPIDENDDYIEPEQLYKEIENELFNRLVTGKQQGKLNKENINNYLPKMLQSYINDYEEKGLKTDGKKLYGIVGKAQQGIVDKLFADENVESSDIDVEFDSLIKKATEKKLSSLKISKIKRLFDGNEKDEAVKQLKELVK